VTAAAGQQVPAALEIGAGVKTVSTARAMSQGPISSTEREYDVAIRGEGFLRVVLPDGTTAYTRDGSLNLDAQGQIVTSDGYLIDPTIAVPDSAVKVTISPTGIVQALLQGQVAAQEIGQIQLSTFVNKSGLSSLGDNLFAETSASGPPSTGNPGEENRGNLQQYYLEEANVNAVTEISNLISAQRAYEMNSKVVTAADQMSSTTSQMFRG
jgi:flagellar basal-body rod protein FlgG